MMISRDRLMGLSKGPSVICDQRQVDLAMGLWGAFGGTVT